MNIILASEWCWDLQMPSQLFPLRLARGFKRCGHSVIGLQGEHDWIPKEKQGKYKAEWGDGCTVPSTEVVSVLDQILEYLPTPDLLIVANTVDDRWYNLADKHGLVIAPFQSDPFYEGLPPKDYIKARYGKADVIFANEGHATNYINHCLGEEKAYTINHALDLTIAPTDEEIEELGKEYLASIVAGLEVRRHGELMRLFYIPSKSFPSQRFAVAGSLHKRFPRSVMNHTNSSCTKKEVEEYSDYSFENVEPVSEPLENAVAGSKAGVVHWDEGTKSYQPWHGGGLSWRNSHRLYAESYFGVNPFGGYLSKSQYALDTKGTKIYEIMGCGAVPICNYLDGMEDLITNGENGFFCETPKEAVAAMQIAVDSPEEAIEMGKLAREKIMESETWDHRVKQIEEIIRGL